MLVEYGAGSTFWEIFEMWKTQGKVRGKSQNPSIYGKISKSLKESVETLRIFHFIFDSRKTQLAENLNRGNFDSRKIQFAESLKFKL